jgi:hypothetical protein
LLYDPGARQTIARDRIETLRADFQAPPSSFRAAVGRRLVRLGARLADEDASRPAQISARLPSGASRQAAGGC